MEVRVIPLFVKSFITKDNTTLYKYVCYDGSDIIEFYSQKQLNLTFVPFNVDKMGVDLRFKATPFSGRLRLSFLGLKESKT